MKVLAASGRGRNNRNRGNQFEREVARKLRDVLATERTGYHDTRDVQGPTVAIQCKKVAALYPERVDRLLREVEALCGPDQVPMVALADVPGSSGKQRSIVVVALDDLPTLIRHAQPTTPPSNCPTCAGIGCNDCCHTGA